MAISYINTTEVEEISKEVINLANEFDNEINQLFSRLTEVPTITREWVGKQANYYAKVTLSEKKQYNDFANKLRKIGSKLSFDSYEIENNMKKISIEETIKEEEM